MSNNRIATSLTLLQIEAVITGMIFAMPILNIFFKDEIGMTLAEVGLSQAVFTVVLFVLNVPTGWLADRFSRKACNIAGDLIAAAGFGYYAFASSFTDVIVAEILVGVGLAFSGGADVALLKAYCDELQQSYAQITARIAKLRPLAEMTAVTVGGTLGASYPRMTIALSAVTYFIGAALSLWLVEAGERRKSDVNPFRDMARIIKYALHGHKRLRWSILAFAVSREATHPLIWLLTPLLLLAGVPAVILGISWALNLMAVWLGAHIAGKKSDRLADWQLVSIGLLVYALSAIVLSINVNLVTICMYAGFGFVRGWFSAIMPPIVQHHTPLDMQSTVTSVAGSIAQMLYAPLIWGVGALGDISPQVAVFGSVLLFTPALSICAYKLRQFEPR